MIQGCYSFYKGLGPNGLEKGTNGLLLGSSIQEDEVVSKILEGFKLEDGKLQN